MPTKSRKRDAACMDAVSDIAERSKPLRVSTSKAHSSKNAPPRQDDGPEDQSRCRERASVACTALADGDASDDAEFEVEEILEHRSSDQGGGESEFLVKWKPTWTPRSCFTDEDGTVTAIFQNYRSVHNL